MDYLRLSLEQLYEVRLDQALYTDDLRDVTTVLKSTTDPALPFQAVTLAASCTIKRANLVRGLLNAPV